MVIAKSFNLDINTPWKAPTLYIKQGDVDSRKLQATIRKDGTNYSIPGDVFATFRMHKPDDTFVTQDCTISGSVVSVVMDAQCATAAGHGKAEFVLQTASEVVSTFLLAIEVMPAAVTDGDIESRDALGEYRTILEEMLRVKGAPLVANTAAGMTDTDRVYVYTGSEVGYVNGSWYYYDGAVWTLGGVYNSQGIGLDYQQEVAQMVKQSAVASESDSVPYLFRPTPNPSAILADEEIVGGTIAWNQLQGQTTSRTNAGITYTYNSTDGTLRVAGTASAASYWESGSTGYKQDYFADHVYLLLAGNDSYAGSGSTYRLYFAQTAFSPRYADTPATMAKPNASGNNYLLQVAVYSGTTVDITLRPQLFDLTAMFGSTIADYLYTLESGTAGAGVAKLREWGFLSKPYFAYDTGSLKSVNTEGKRVYDKNNNLLATYPTTPTDLNGIFKLDANNQLYADGDVYKSDGTITRNYTYRDYEAGDESLANAITDGVHTVVKKNTPTTETADPYTATQIVGKGGTEEWIDSRAVPVPVGHRTQYSIGVPDVPANANAATLKATVSGGKTTLSWS